MSKESIDLSKIKSANEATPFIDHTLLKAEATEEDVKGLCAEAKEFGFASVCVNPHYVKLASKELKKSGVKVCTVIGFPLGSTPKEVKAFETERAIAYGAREVDMVLNIAAMKSGDHKAVKSDIAAVVKAAKGSGKDVIVKVILETCYLSDEEIKKASELAMAAKAHFVKTSTGFGTAGAKAAHVNIMKETVGDKLEVKASGGIKKLAHMKSMFKAGATRLGMGRGSVMSLMRGSEESGSSY